MQAVQRGAALVPFAVVTFITLPFADVPNSVLQGLPLPLPITPGPPPTPPPPPPPPPPPVLDVVLEALLDVLPQPLKPLLDDEDDDEEDDADDVLEAEDDTDAEIGCCPTTVCPTTFVKSSQMAESLTGGEEPLNVSGESDR